MNSAKKEYLQNLVLGDCELCGEPTEISNSALVMHYLAVGRLIDDRDDDRHVYPVGDCPGSPGRLGLIDEYPNEWGKANEIMLSFSA